MGSSELIEQYKKERDSEKKFEILRKILALLADKKDPSLNTWVQEILKYKPQELPLSQFFYCPNCKKTMRQSKKIKAPPRAEFLYLMCEDCKIERLVAYLSPYSKGVVHLRDTSIYSNIEKLKKFVESHYDVELKPMLEKISAQSKDPAIRAFSQYKLAKILKSEDPLKSEKLFEISFSYYTPLKFEKSAEFEDISQNLITSKIKNEKPEEAIKIIDQLFEYAQKTKNIRLEIICNINKAVALEILRKYEKAVDFYTDAMNLAEEKNQSDLFNQASVRLQELLEEIREMDVDSSPDINANQ